MPPLHTALDAQDNLRSAALAAASWVRARRATWTREPVSVETLTDPSFEALADPVIVHAAVPAAGVPAPAPAAPVAVRAPRTFSFEAALRWLGRGAIAAALLAAVVAGARFLWTAVPGWLPRAAVIEPAPAKPATSRPSPPPPVTGSLRVTSTPPGARVLVDGKPRGITPLSLTDLSPGRHDVALQSSAGSVQRTVNVSATAPTTIDEAIFSGFVTVYAPFDVTVSEGGRVLRADERQQIMLPPGPHDLRLANRALGYDVVRRVVVAPGENANLRLTPDPALLTVTAAEAADVWLDGTRLGDTPLTSAPVPLGVHEILVRRASGGERRFTITFGTKPVTLNVVF